MAQERVTVNNQLKSGVQLVGRELARIDEQVHLLDVQSQKVQESSPPKSRSDLVKQKSDTQDMRLSPLISTKQCQELANSPGIGTYSSTKRLFE